MCFVFFFIGTNKLQQTWMGWRKRSHSFEFVVCQHWDISRKRSHGVLLNAEKKKRVLLVHMCCSLCADCVFHICSGCRFDAWKQVSYLSQRHHKAFQSPLVIKARNLFRCSSDLTLSQKRCALMSMIFLSFYKQPSLFCLLQIPLYFDGCVSAWPMPGRTGGIIGLFDFFAQLDQCQFFSFVRKKRIIRATRIVRRCLCIGGLKSPWSVPQNENHTAGSRISCWTLAFQFDFFIIATWTQLWSKKFLSKQSFDAHVSMQCVWH